MHSSDYSTAWFHGNQMLLPGELSTTYIKNGHRSGTYNLSMITAWSDGVHDSSVVTVWMFMTYSKYGYSQEC